MFAIIRDIIRTHPPEGLTSREETRTAPSSAPSSTLSATSTEEMKRSREERDERKAAGRLEEKRTKTSMKKKEKEEEEVEEKVVIQGRTEKEVECMPKKVIEKIHEIETTRVRPIIHRDRYQVEVHQVIQPVVEKVIKATTLEVKQPIVEERGHRVEEATWTPTLGEKSKMGPAPEVQSVTKPITRKKHFEEMPPVIEEVVHRKIIEHITPIVLKEVVLPNLEIEEAVPESVLTAPDVHTQVGRPIVIERLVIRSRVESVEERLERLEAKQQRKAQKRAMKEELKAQKRAAKMELKAQKRAAKLERKALKKALAQQELEQKTELAVRNLHEKHLAELEMKMKKAEQAEAPEVVVTRVDERESEELPTPVEVITTVDEVTSKTVTTEAPTETTLAAASEKLQNYSPLNVTTDQAEGELKTTLQKKEEVSGEQNLQERTSGSVATPQQII